MRTSFVIFACIAGCLVQGSTVLDVLRSHRETTLLSFITAANLTSVLSGPGPFTIFAPTNSAFYHMNTTQLAALKADPVALANLLKYHVVSGSVMSTDLQVNEKMLQSLSGQDIRVNYYMYTRHTAVQGARILQANLKAGNGVVHIVDKVLQPPAGTIYDIISTDPMFKTLKTLVDAAGLATMLTEGPYTLFAPSDRAFDQLGNDTLQSLMANLDLLKSASLYHIVHGTLYSTGMHSGSLHTLEEIDQEHLYASFGGSSASVDGARVMQKDISATNGVIHVISRVLVPASLQTAFANL